MRALLTVTCLVPAVLAAATAWSAPTLQQSTTTESMEVVLSTADARARVRQQVTAPLRAGTNRLTFTWSGEKIDAESVRLHAGPQLLVGETIRPAGSGGILAWDVTAPVEGEYAVTISYLLADLKWTPSYRLSYRPGDDRATLEGYVTVSNDSGLPLEDAALRLALGRATGEEAAGQALELLADLAGQMRRKYT